MGLLTYTTGIQTRIQPVVLLPAFMPHSQQLRRSQVFLSNCFCSGRHARSSHRSVSSKQKKFQDQSAIASLPLQSSIRAVDGRPQRHGKVADTLLSWWSRSHCPLGSSERPRINVPLPCRLSATIDKKAKEGAKGQEGDARMQP